MLSRKVPVSPDSRVSVSLANLIDLASYAVRIKLHNPQFRARQSGGYVSRFKGRGMEFEEARIYQAGDDIRSIDWRVTARTGTAHTKIFREERERPVFISVDNRVAMHFATRGVFKSVLAAKLAGLLAWTAQGQGDRIGGQLFSEQFCRELKPQNGRQAVLRFLDLLVKGEGGQKDGNASAQSFSLEHVLARLAHHTRPGSLVYVISDFRGINAQAEIHLAKLAEHCDVVLVFVYDALEKHLPAHKGRYRFIDQDREVIIDSADGPRLLAYHQHFAGRQQRLEQLAKKRGLVLIQSSTTEDPLQCLR
ncbi:MAG: DUF58 domain-containing protein [Methylovulum sp.]|uniref:DUF58 domain-containing protein n=1 Tax=Methylovulum sp. TaxID=1916980 RepID=UPI00261D52C4|nr:DUF58 domain-containing protein [Methylovulum sp.]MDD2724799.1 DUF58 domain-containing protein [Methylovulum sp.]MDD5126115.1 DUF58 domain-containing protein [Methylovulum sp.]